MKCYNFLCQHRYLNKGDCMSIYGCDAKKAFERFRKFMQPEVHTADEIIEYWERTKKFMLKEKKCG